MTETKTPVVEIAAPSAEKTAISKIIDLAVDPFVPKDNWEVTHHKKEIIDKDPKNPVSQIEWNSKRIHEHLSEGQDKKIGRSVQGNHLEYETTHLNNLNVNVLHFLEKNPQEIPEDFWPTGDAVSKSNVFWGTRYKSTAGKRFVPCLLCFQDRIALVSYLPLDHGFNGSDPAITWK